MVEVQLRPVRPEDLDAIFEQMREPESVRMAAFTTEDPNDRAAFDAHMARVMSSPDMNLQAILCDSELVGTTGNWVAHGVTEVTYWVDRAHWGRGIASGALALLIGQISARPIQARVANDNAGSLRVLEKAGFRPISTGVDFAPGRRAEVEEIVLELR